MKEPWWGEGGWSWSRIFLKSALFVVSDQRHAPAALPPRKSRGTHCIGGCLGTSVGLDGYIKQKVSLSPEFELRTAQPGASRYTGYNNNKYYYYYY